MSGIESIWYGDRIADRLARVALLPLTALYAGGWQVYRSIYDLGLKRAQQPHSRILCVGNLRVGGSGKTPTTIAIAEWCAREGWPVVIGASGYGSPRSEAATLAPSGPLDPNEWGDEPALLRHRLPDVPLVVGRRRILAAELVAQTYPDHLLLMDDGFQHLPLKKTATLLIDPPGENSWPLPSGPYREPRLNRLRATARIPDDFRLVAEPLAWRYEGPDRGTRPTAALTAIARPERFLRELPGIGRTRVLPDHHPLPVRSWQDAFQPDDVIATTEKDWVKLRQDAAISGYSFAIASYRARIDPPEAFSVWMRDHLL